MDPDAHTVFDCADDGFHFSFTTNEGPETIIQNVVLLNGQSAAGGSVFIAGASPTFRHVVFKNNAAFGNGGAVTVASGNPTFIDAMFINNMAGGNGGALSVCGGAQPTLRSVTFVDNVAGDIGGGLYFSGAAPNIAILGGNFTNNAAHRGGGIYSDTALSLTSCDFVGNVASQYGGGLAVVPSAALGVTIAANDVTFINNVANTGAGVFSYSANFELAQGVFASNEALIGGGALYSICSETYRTLNEIEGACAVQICLVNVSVVNNTVSAGDGGGLMLDHVVATLSGVNIENNAASGDGGGVFAQSSNVSASAQSTVAHNTAGGNGGGVYCDATGFVVMSGGALRYNSAGAAGGGYYYCYAGCLPEISDLVPADPAVASASVSNNQAVKYGNDRATDASTISWIIAPDASVISGYNLAENGSLLLNVRDRYAQAVASDAGVLTLTLLLGSTPVHTVMLLGPTSTLISTGVAQFTNAGIVARGVPQTGLTYTLACAYAGLPVVVTAPVTLLTCQAGQGVSAVQLANVGLMCKDCLAGSRSNVDTSQPCVTCLAGSFAATPALSLCTNCSTNTFQQNPGQAACQPCPFDTHADSGATECIPNPPPPPPPPSPPPAPPSPPTVIPPAATIITPVAAPSISSATLGGIIGGVAAALILLVAILVRCVYARTKRKTMEKYYLDEDSTVRVGTGDAGLALTVKKMIGATNTTRIGGGEFADVYKAKYNDIWVALKVIKGEAVGRTMAQTEFHHEVIALSTLSNSKHPAIIDFFFYLERNPMCIALEYCPNGSLKKQLPNLPLNAWDKVRIAAQLASALAHLHGHNIVHLDIKTDNILLTDSNDIKLIDFGISKLLSTSTTDDAASRRASTALDSGSTIASPMNSMNANINMNANPVFGIENAYANGGGNNNKRASMASVGSMSQMQMATFNSLAEDTGPIGFTPQYVDPYRLLNEYDQEPETLRRSDVFCFAMVMWVIQSKQEPFSGIDVATLVKLRKEQPSMRPPPLTDCHVCYDKLMQRAWDTDPALRPPMHQCLTELCTCLRDHFNTSLDKAYLDVRPPPAETSRPERISMLATMNPASAANLSVSSGDQADLQTMTPPPPSGRA